MNFKKLLFIHRVWGFSLGMMMLAGVIDTTFIIRALLIMPGIYFLMFGDNHFKKYKKED